MTACQLFNWQLDYRSSSSVLGKVPYGATTTIADFGSSLLSMALCELFHPLIQNFHELSFCDFIIFLLHLSSIASSISRVSLSMNSLPLSYMLNALVSHTVCTQNPSNACKDMGHIPVEKSPLKVVLHNLLFIQYTLTKPFQNLLIFKKIYRILCNCSDTINIRTNKQMNYF